MGTSEELNRGKFVQIDRVKIASPSDDVVRLVFRQTFLGEQTGQLLR